MFVSSIQYPNKFTSTPNFELNKYMCAFDMNTLELTRHILKLNENRIISQYMNLALMQLNHFNNI